MSRVPTRKALRRYLLLALALVLPAAAQAAPLGIVDIPEPDHLVPVDPYPGDWHKPYADQIRSRFKLDGEYFAQMVVRPSFSPECVIRLRAAEDELNFDEVKQFVLTYSAAGKNIWYSMPENNEKKEQREVTVATATVEVSKPVAGRICQLWRRMLLRTRYHENGSRGLDGTIFEFSIRGAYGETWSPRERKSPLLFVELGESLVAYCKAAPAERPAAMKTFESKAAQLEKYLDKHPTR